MELERLHLSVHWCFIGGYKHYCMKSIPKIANLLKVLDEVIMKQLIPSVTGGTECSDIEF